MRKSVLAGLALVFATAVAVPALAHGNAKNFPMPAAEFQQHVDARIQRARAHMEKDIVDRKLSDAQAKELRAHFDTVVANVGAEVQKAVADGTVTLDEAKTVRAVARDLRPHRDHSKST
jgi:hypothetical protein